MYIRRFFGREGIISNPSAFDPDYIPEEMPFREGQLEALAREITFFVRRGTPTNLFLWGPPGTGKTASVLKILGEASAVFTNLRTVYVNAWKYRTRMGILSEVARQMGIAVPVRGVSADTVFSSIEMRIEEERVVIALDEADRLAGSDVLYDLSRLGSRAMLITIANGRDFLSVLDPRITSTLFQSDIEYPPYTVPQLTEILRRRAEVGLVPGTWDEEVLRACAAVGFARGGDARIAIACLFNAAKLAEAEEAERIEVRHVKEARKGLSPQLDLEPKLAWIVEILKEKGPLTSSELYAEYSKRNPVTVRAFRNYLKELERMGIVEVERVRKRGNVRLVRLRQGI